MENNMVYICSPYRGDTVRNIEYAKELTRAAVAAGYAPVTTHLYLTQALDDENPEEREAGMSAGAEILHCCRYFLIGARYGISEGMKAEIRLAKEEKKIFLFEGKKGEMLELQKKRKGSENDKGGID